MHSEQKKLILVVAILAIAVGIYWRYGRARGPLADRVDFVCVATGKKYALARGDIPTILPAKNPKTGQLTLVPCEESDGKLIVKPRYAHLLDEPELAKANKYVDRQTLEVLDAPRQ